VTAVSDELPAQDSVLPVGAEEIEAEDVLLTSAPARPIPVRMPAAWIAHDRANLLQLTGPDHEPALQPIDQLAEAVVTSHVLSSLNDDSVTSSSSSRQSA
jgi:hypothetical protein